MSHEILFNPICAMEIILQVLVIPLFILESFGVFNDKYDIRFPYFFLLFPVLFSSTEIVGTDE